jgi:hypothetical protein
VNQGSGNQGSGNQGSGNHNTAVQTNIRESSHQGVLEISRTLNALLIQNQGQALSPERLQAVINLYRDLVAAPTEIGWQRVSLRDSLGNERLYSVPSEALSETLKLGLTLENLVLANRIPPSEASAKLYFAVAEAHWLALQATEEPFPKYRPMVDPAPSVSRDRFLGPMLRLTSKANQNPAVSREESIVGNVRLLSALALYREQYPHDTGVVPEVQKAVTILQLHQPEISSAAQLTTPSAQHDRQLARLLRDGLESARKVLALSATNAPKNEAGIVNHELLTLRAMMLRHDKEHPYYSSDAEVSESLAPVHRQLEKIFKLVGLELDRSLDPIRVTFRKPEYILPACEGLTRLALCHINAGESPAARELAQYVLDFLRNRPCAPLLQKYKQEILHFAQVLIKKAGPAWGESSFS